LPLTASAGTIALTGLDADLLAMAKDIAAGHTYMALTRYDGRFLPSDDLHSEDFRDWRDGVEEEIAHTISEILQEQSHVCGTNSLQEIIRLSELILLVHPHLTGAQIALIEATARTGQSQKAQRIYSSMVAADPDQGAMLPPVSSFLARSAASPETHSVPFSGRDNEMSVLLERWQKATTAEGQVVVVLGEPGIGKTRLADQFLRRVAIRGGGVWIANCCAATQRLPYSVVNELVREHVESPSATWTRLFAVGEAQPELLQLTDNATDEYRCRLTEGLTEYLIGRSKEQPMAILIDDAQWADEYTSLLVAYWAYRLRGERVMLLLTVRTQEAEPPPNWILADLGRPWRLQVGQISVAAAEEIVTAFEHNHEVAFHRSVKDAVLWQSGGRPFLLLEALAFLLGEGETSRLPNAALSEPAESLLLRRFYSLPHEARRVVSILAVWGRPIPTATLQSMSRLSGEVYAYALNVLHSRGIAHLHDSIVSFPHDLMRETAYRSVLPATRALNHGQAAAELLAAAGPEGLIAQHYAHAGNAEATGQHCLRAADEALSSYSYSDHEYYCRLCLKAGGQNYKRKAALALARHLVQVGRTAELDELVPFFAADDSQCRTLRSISQLEQELASGRKSVTDILRYAMDTVAAAGAADDPTRASLAATLFDVAFDACVGDLDYTDVASLSRDDSYRTSDVQLQMESVLSVWHGATRSAEAGLSMASATIGRLSSTTSPTTRAACLYSYASLLLLSGHVTAARAQFEVALGLACETGDVRRQLSIFINNGVALMEAGEMGAARHSLEKVVTSSNIHFRVRGYTNLALLHYEEGEWPLAAQAAEAVLSMNASYESPSLGSISHALLGLMAIQEGDNDVARSHATKIGELSWNSLDDTSYTATFLSQMLIASDHKADALSLLSEAMEKTRMRDVLCTMRLQCQTAAILTSSQPETAYRMARAVERKANALGAYSVSRRASRILGRVP
jgi:tetratricopeptide (TPR) repeat protein